MAMHSTISVPPPSAVSARRVSKAVKSVGIHHDVMRLPPANASAATQATCLGLARPSHSSEGRVARLSPPSSTEK